MGPIPRNSSWQLMNDEAIRNSTLLNGNKPVRIVRVVAPGNPLV